jgi:hypothetical protein
METITSVLPMRFVSVVSVVSVVALVLLSEPRAEQGQRSGGRLHSRNGLLILHEGAKEMVGFLYIHNSGRATATRNAPALSTIFTC